MALLNPPQILPNVARVLFRLDVIGPVDLHKRHAVLDQSAGQEARLSETCAAIAVGQFRALL